MRERNAAAVPADRHERRVAEPGGLSVVRDAHAAQRTSRDVGRYTWTPPVVFPCIRLVEALANATTAPLTESWHSRR